MKVARRAAVEAGGPIRPHRPSRRAGHEVPDGKGATQPVQGSAAGGSDAADGDPRAPTDLGVGQGRVLHEQAEQLALPRR